MANTSRPTSAGIVAAKPVPRLFPGILLCIPESEYCYGVGALLLRVTHLNVTPAEVPHMEWVTLRGQQLSNTGADFAEREVVVRVSALAEAVRPTGWLPGQR